MKIHQIIALTALSLAATACVNLGGGKPPAQLLNLTSSQTIAADSIRSARAGEAITIGVPTVPQAIANNRVAVSDGPTAIAYVKDAQWVEPPARLFHRLLSETIAAKTGKVVLDARQFAMDPGVTLNGNLMVFGVDARRNEAVIVYDAAISRDKGKRVETRRFEARSAISAVTPMEAGNALNQAANKMAGEVAAWVAGG